MAASNFQYSSGTPLPGASQHVFFSYEDEQDGEQKIPMRVSVYRAGRDARIFPDASLYAFAVVYDNKLRYPNGKHIQENHFINWDELPNGMATLKVIRKSYSIFTVATAYFDEIN